MKRVSLALMFVTLLTIFLVACGDEPGSVEEPDVNDPISDDAGEGDEGADVDEAMPEKPEKLTVWVNDEEKQEEAIREITEIIRVKQELKLNLFQ